MKTESIMIQIQDELNFNEEKQMTTTQSNVPNGTNNEERSVSIVVKKETVFDGIRFQSPREQYVNEYTHFAVKTAQSTIEMCRVVYEAKSTLAQEDYKSFCADIGHKSEDSTVRKYLAIGAAYDRLVQRANLLPNSWTSIYLITQLPSETFEALAITGNSMANMNGSQIKALIDSSKKTTDDSKKIDADVCASTDKTQCASDAPSVSTDVTEQSSQEADVSDSTPSLQSTSTNESDRTDSSAMSSSVSASVADTETDESIENTDDARIKQAAFTKNTRLVDVVQSTDDDKIEPYELVLSFNARPIDAAISELVESLLRIKTKYRLDFEIKSEAAALV